MEYRNSYFLSLTLALGGGGVEAMHRYRLCRSLGGTQGRCGRMRKISPTGGFDPRTFHPVASCYTVGSVAEIVGSNPAESMYV